MPKWRNWSGKLGADVEALHFVRSENDARELAQIARRNGQTVRSAGACHSHSPLVQTNGILADLSGLSGVVSTDAEHKTAWIWAGTRIYALGRPLRDASLALPNQGDIDQQAIAGATATGTHGTGITLGNLSSRVVGYELATGNGDLITVDSESDPELFAAGQLHLGALGIMTKLELQLREAYKLAEEAWTQQLDDLLADIPKHVESNRHFEFFWYPQTDEANVKVINETSDEPVYPLAAEGSRVAWSYEVLPNHRPHKHTEMEYSVPLERGVACLVEIQRLLRDRFTDVRWPVEYRTLAADDVWLSTAFDRPTVTISVHQDVNEDDEPYFRACEEIFLAHGGRPHWGKVNYLSGADLAARHPCWDDWWRARDAIDPSQTFLNDYLKGIRP
jgi:FAD/FMN-containing dehydrogenase